MDPYDSCLRSLILIVVSITQYPVPYSGSGYMWPVSHSACKALQLTAIATKNPLKMELILRRWAVEAADDIVASDGRKGLARLCAFVDSGIVKDYTHA